MSNKLFPKSLFLTLSLLFAFSLLLSAEARADATVTVVPTQVDPSPTDAVQVGVPVRLVNDVTLNAGSLGFYYARGDASVDSYLTIDSVSLAGGGAENSLSQCSVDPSNHLGVLGFIYFPGLPGATPVPPGDSLLGTIWFTVAAGAPDAVIPIDSGYFPPAGEFVFSDAGGLSVFPEFVSGTLTIGEPAPQADLDVSPDTLTFNAQEGGSNPSAQSFSIENVGGGTLDWTATEIAGWFDLSAYSGTAPSTVDVTVDISGLTANTYVDSVIVDGGDAANSPQSVVIILDLEPPPPVIVLSDTIFDFEATEGEKILLYDTLTITNGGGGTLNWAAANTQAWLTLAPGSGTAPSDMELLVNTDGLDPNTYQDSIEISATGATNSPRKVYVNLTINEPPPQIALSDTLFTFEAMEGEKATFFDTLSITNVGGGILEWNGANSKPWLTIDPASDTAPSVVELTVVTDGLTPDIYYDTITISSAEATNSPQRAFVQLTINEQPPEIFVDPDNFTFDVTVGDNPPDQYMSISNTGGGTLNFSLSNLESWLITAPGSGTAPETCTLSVVSDTLPIGMYYDTITVSAPGATSVAVPVTLNVLDQDPVIVLSESLFSFSLVDGNNTAVDTLSITNGGGGTLNWSTSSPKPWLTLNPASGTAPSDVELTVDGSGQSIGTYYDTISVTSAEATNSPQLFEVILEITEAELVVTSGGIAVDSLGFQSEFGASPDPQTLDIESTGDPLNWTSSNSSSWLNVDPPSGTTPTAVEISVDTTGLTPDTYYDTLIISESIGKQGDSVAIEIFFVLTEPAEQPILSVDPLFFDFEAIEGGPNPSSQSFSVENVGTGTLDWEAFYDAGWLTLSENSGTAPSNVDVEIDITGLVADSYIDTITISAPGAENTPQYVEVNLLVKPPLQGGDTVWVACDTVEEGQTAEVEITFANDNLIAGIQIPLDFDPAYVFCDSVVFGPRVDYIANLIKAIDNVEGTINIGVIPFEEPLIDTGQGLLATLYFTGISAGYTDIDTGFIAPASEYVFVGEYNIEFIPEFYSGCVLVEAPPFPCIEVSDTSFFFEAEELGPNPADQYLTISNCGAPGLDWTASNNEAWLTLDPMSGGDDDVITLSVDITGLSPDDYYDTITISDPLATNSPVYVPVMLTVNEVGPPGDTIRVTTTYVIPSPTDEVFFGVPITIYATQLFNAGSLGFYYARGDASVDSYLTIDSVTLTGGAAENSLSQCSVDPPNHLGVLGFIYFPGLPGASPVPPGDSLLGTLWFTLAAGAPNAVIPIDSGYFPPAGEFVLADSAGLSVSPYFVPGDIIVSAGIEETELVVEPDTLFFTGQLGSPNPEPQSVSITAVEVGKAQLDWVADFDASWLSMVPLTGTTPSDPEVSVDMTGLDPGPYSETIVITAEDAINSPQEVFVIFEVLPEPVEGLEGTVVNADDMTPIEDATVDVFDVFGGTLLASTQTDVNGEFSFPSLPEDNYYVRAYKDGYYPDDFEVLTRNIVIELELVPTGEITPTYEWVNFYCDSTYLDWTLVQVGDVVEAYTDDGTLLCGQFFVHTVGRYGLMAVYRDDEFTPEKDGCYPGDTITFTINGFAAETDIVATWTFNGDITKTCLTAFSIYEVCLELDEGWNLISWNVDTESDDIEDLIADIKDDVDVILGFEAGALTYDPDPDMSQFNTLSELDHYHGYWFRMINPATFCVEGNKVAASTPIALEMGWNLASYLPDEEDEIEHALSSIMDYLLVVLGYDNGGQSYQPDLRDYSTLDTLRPGFGYWIKVTTDVMLIYPDDNGGPFAKMVPDVFTDYSDRSSVVTSNVWVNLYGQGVTVNGDLLAAGTELDVVDANGDLRGNFTVSEVGRFGFMPVYGAENGSAKGLREGEEFSIRVNGQQTEETFTFTGSGDRIVVGSLTLKSGGTNPLPERYSLNQNYPNPFNPATTIAYEIPAESMVELTIYNILGERVATLVNEVKPAGSYKIVWNGQNDSGSPVSSGIYFYRLTAGDYVKSMKMTLMK